MAATMEQASAIAWFKATLASWGIADLVPDAQKLVLQGLGADAITLALSQTAAYKKRFSGNELRRKAGLRELSPAEYVANETSYAGILRQYGLPKGFYDSRDDFTKFIASDVSPQELAQRAQDAQETFLTGPAENRQAWRDMYGLSDGAAIASILDPTRALPLVEKQLTAAKIGGAALGQGLSVGRTQAEYLAASGVTDTQARKGYADIATALPVDQGIAQRFGDHIVQTEEEAAAFGVAGAADALEKKRRLAASETGLFSGKSGADSASLSRSTVGSY
jgi:hypothetical protein